jgi:hypothetical protein
MSFDNSRLDIFGDRTFEVPMNVEIQSLHSVRTTKTRRENVTEKFGSAMPVL